MKKITTLLIALLFISSTAMADVKGPFGYDLGKDIHRDQEPNTSENSQINDNREESSVDENDTSEVQSNGNGGYASGENEWENAQVYYDNATLSGAINKYKAGNYSGCLQELISVVKKDPFNPVVFYYMGMAYTQVGNKQQAINAYEAVINLNASRTLTDYSIRGRDCLVGGPTCSEDTVQGVSIENDLDRFINAPYGNGLSEELNKQMREQKLENIKKRIYTKDTLNEEDIKKIREFDHSRSQNSTNNEKLASADKTEVTNEDVLSAIETLKKAGVTVSINPYNSQIPMNDEYAQLSMMLGSNNNNNNSMMNMLPLLMTQNNGQKIDPQVIQTMMMSSMLPDFTSNNDKKDY